MNNDAFEMANADGSLRGDSKNMPNRGTTTNVTDTYGADLGLTAKGRMKGISAFTKSDAPDECYGDASEAVI